MSKRSVFTTITPLPAGITRETVIETLRNHFEMIDLNPLVINRKKAKAPSFAGGEEYHATWYEITDKIQYLPGAKSSVSYFACFHDMATGLQTHVYAPAGLDIKGKWSLGGSLPGEPIAPVELGLNIPKQGLYLREDVDMKCNFMLSSFVKKTLKKAHGTLVGRLLEKANIAEVVANNERVDMIEQWQRSTSETASDAGSIHGSTIRGSVYAPSFAGSTNHHMSMAQSDVSSLRGSVRQYPANARDSMVSQLPPRGSPQLGYASSQHGHSPGQPDPTYQSYNPHSNPHNYSDTPKRGNTIAELGYHDPRVPAQAEAGPVELPASNQQHGVAELAG